MPADDSWTNTQLRILLLKSSPVDELLPTTKYIDRLIEYRRRHHSDSDTVNADVDQLIEAILSLGDGRAESSLVAYANSSGVSDLTQIRTMTWLAARHSAALASVLRRWMARHPDRIHWVREAAEKDWGEFGRQVLKQVESQKTSQ